MKENPRSLETLTDLELTTLIHQEDQERLRLFCDEHQIEMALMTPKGREQRILDYAKAMPIGPNSENALAVLWTRHMREVERYIDKLGRKLYDPELLQYDVKIKLWRMNEDRPVRWICSYRGDGSFAGFVKTVAQTTMVERCRNEQRGRRRESVPPRGHRWVCPDVGKFCYLRGDIGHCRLSAPNHQCVEANQHKAESILTFVALEDVPDLVSEIPGPLHAVIGRQICDLVASCIDWLVQSGKMEPRGAWALRQRYFRGLGWEDIAEEFSSRFGGSIPVKRQDVQYWAKKAGEVLRRDLETHGIDGSHLVAWE